MSSRHELRSLQPGYIVAIGWDNPMQTYFAQVEREQDDEDERDPVVLWLGGRKREVPTPEVMSAALDPWLTLSPELIMQLKADRAADLDRAPTNAQRNNLATIDALRRCGRLEIE